MYNRQYKNLLIWKVCIFFKKKCLHPSAPKELLWHNPVSYCVMFQGTLLLYLTNAIKANLLYMKAIQGTLTGRGTTKHLQNYVNIPWGEEAAHYIILSMDTLIHNDLVTTWTSIILPCTFSQRKKLGCVFMFQRWCLSVCVISLA